MVDFQENFGGPLVIHNMFYSFWSSFTSLTMWGRTHLNHLELPMSCEPAQKLRKAWEVRKYIVTLLMGHHISTSICVLALHWTWGDPWRRRYIPPIPIHISKSAQHHVHAQLRSSNHRCSFRLQPRYLIKTSSAFSCNWVFCFSLRISSILSPLHFVLGNSRGRGTRSYTLQTTLLDIVNGREVYY